MIERLAAGARRLDGDGQVFFDLGLSDEFGQALRAQFQFERRIVFDRRGRNQPLLQIRNVFGGSH